MPAGGAGAVARGQHRARDHEPLRPDAVGPDRAVRPHVGRQPGDVVQAEPLDPRAEHHHHQRLLAAAAVRGRVRAAVPEERRPAPAAADARPGHRVVGLPRLGDHHGDGHQAGERARRVAGTTVRGRLARVPADRQRHIHQPDHIAAVRQRQYITVPTRDFRFRIFRFFLIIFFLVATRFLLVL